MAREDPRTLLDTLGDFADGALDVVQRGVRHRDDRNHHQCSDPLDACVRNASFLREDVQERNRRPVPEIQRVAALSQPLRRATREQALIQQRVGTCDDHEHRAHHRHQRCNARPARSAIDAKCRDEDQRDACR